MKAISLWQPWASLIAVGVKTWETRSWSTAYRGRILVHASKTFGREARRFAESLPCRRDLERGGIRGVGELPLGAFVAVADLVDVRRCDGSYDGIDAEYGDFSAGRWMWRLENVQRFQHPLIWRGMMGLFDVSEEVVGWVTEKEPVKVPT